jgi:hypothetical protein
MPDEPTKPKWPKIGAQTEESGKVTEFLDDGMRRTVFLRFPVFDETGQAIGEQIARSRLPDDDYSWAWMESWCFDNITPGKPCGINEWLASVIKKLGSDTSDEMKDTAREAVSWCKQTLEALAKNDAPMAANLAFKAGLAVQEYIMRRQFEIDVRRSKSSIEGAKQPKGPGNEHLQYITEEHPEWLALKPTQIRAKLVANKRMAPGDENGESGWKAASEAIRRHLKKHPR